jgi:hypothetical protein
MLTVGIIAAFLFAFAKLLRAIAALMTAIGIKKSLGHKMLLGSDKSG